MRIRIYDVFENETVCILNDVDKVIDKDIYFTNGDIYYHYISINDDWEELKGEDMVTRSWKVYGMTGHRQRESFNKSYKYDFEPDRIIEVLNSDKTGTNEYTIIRITRNTADECEEELNGQLSDGIFENSRTGIVEEI